MVHSISTKARYFTVAALLFGVVLFTSAWTPAAYGDSAQVSKLLQQAKASADELQRDTEVMESYVRSQVTWRGQADKIVEIKKHINKIGSILAELHDARDGAAPWQQDAIDGITPLMHQLATHTTSIIDHLNKTNETWQPQYKEYLRANRNLAADVSKMITDYTNYGKARAMIHGQQP